MASSRGKTDGEAQATDQFDIQPPLAVDAEISDNRQRYGLSMEPFGEDQDFPLFTGAQRREVLDQLFHLCQFGHSLLVVMGDQGVGKSRIAHALLDLLSETHQSSLVNAQEKQDLEPLLKQVVQDFGIRSSGNEAAGQLLASLRSFSQPIMGGGELAVVVVDNAHHLNDQTLAALLSLLQGQQEEHPRLHLVFFAELPLIDRLDQLDMHDVMINDFYLERFALDETVEYLNYRLEMADYLGPEIFTDAIVEPWWLQSHGRLPIIHRYARDYLLESMLSPADRSAKSFPIWHIVAAALLGALILMVYFYHGDEEEPKNQIFVSTSIPINSARPAVSGEASSSESSGPTGFEEGGSSLDAVMSESSSARASNAPQQALGLDDSAISSGGEPKISAPPVEKPLPKQDPLRVDIGEQKPAPQPEIKKPDPQPVVQSSASIFSADERILLSWREAEFTLQLVGVSTEKAAKDFIAKQSNRDDLLMFQTQRKGKDWFVVVAGRHSDAAAARQAINNLPAGQAKAGPWPRQMKVIQAEIRAGRGL